MRRNGEVDVNGFLKASQFFKSDAPKQIYLSTLGTARDRSAEVGYILKSIELAQRTFRVPPSKMDPGCGENGYGRGRFSVEHCHRFFAPLESFLIGAQIAADIDDIEIGSVEL